LGVITQRTCRHYIGADADKASIPAAAKTAGDVFIATDTKYWYQWTGAAWVWIVPDASIVEGKIGPLACTEGKIGNLAISAGKIQTNAVETAKIKDLNVTVGKLAGGITAGKLAADCVETVKIKDLNVTKAKAELGFGRYVPRAVATWDWGIGDFTVDGNVHANGLNCSAIVPVGAIAIHFSIYCRDGSAGSDVILYGNQTTKANNNIDVRTQAVNIANFGHGIINCDADRLIDYLITAGMDAVGVSVLGYYI